MFFDREILPLLEIQHQLPFSKISWLQEHEIIWWWANFSLNMLIINDIGILIIYFDINDL